MLRCMSATHVDSIRIVDVRKRGDSFEHTIAAALQLVREHDPRRYKRITRHINWIVNEFSHSQGLEYNPRIRVCSVEFCEPEGVNQELLAAVYACSLVHEATHGVISDREIPYDGEDRRRIERLCVAEQNRFASRLAQADPVRFPLELLRMGFDESAWMPAWTTSRFEKALRLFSRARRDWNAGPRAAPSGSPALPVGNSGVSEGPPSVTDRSATTRL